MRNVRTVNDFGRKNIAVLAALAVSAMVATPFVMSASRALATSDEPAAVTASLRVEPVEISPVAAPKPATCLRKVRVVYSGYGTPVDGCATR
jgi:hypothetical protein